VHKDLVIVPAQKREKINPRKSIRFSRAIDVFVVVLCVSIAVYFLNLFRLDLFQTIDAQNETPVGTITIKNNTVQRRISNRVLWDRLAIESPVYMQDLIRVAELSAATLHIEGNDIELDENTLIRIQPSSDGSGLQIELSSGNLGVVSGAESEGISLNLMGREVKAEAGSVLKAQSGAEGLQLQVSEGSAVLLEGGESRAVEAGMSLAMDTDGTERRDPSVVVSVPRSNARYVKSSPDAFLVNFAWNRINLEAEENLKLEVAADREFTHIVHTIENLDAEQTSAEVALEEGIWRWRLLYEDAVLSSGQITITDAAGTKLLNPVTGSVLRYNDEAPSLRFQWTESEGALSYNVQISENADFRNTKINTETSVPFFVDNSLAENTWYWRVMPIFPSLYEGSSAFSAPASFRIEQSESNNPEVLAVEIPDTAIEAALIAASPTAEIAAAPEPIIEAVIPEPPPALPPPRRVQAPPTVAAAPPLLAAPSNLLPIDGSILGFEELRRERKIDFSWSPVTGASSYIITINYQDADGSRQVFRTNPLRGTTWTLDRLALLERGNFTWQAEAVITNALGTITRRGRIAESSFIVDIPPNQIELEDVGVLYGN
jgi:hypothetical protein